MLVSKKAMTMPPCKVTALFETMQYGVHRILTFLGTKRWLCHVCSPTRFCCKIYALLAWLPLKNDKFAKYNIKDK